ncbi:hypothetical protein DIPPA_03833 [Diplonema papillatum]|nr:hypothetical protein DIPPA_03833 [Diplonema papillatum]
MLVDEDPSDERYADILDDLVALALKGSEKWSDGTIKEACEEGAEDATFRHIVTTLMAEATGMALDTRQKLGYYKTVQYGLKSTRFDTFVVLDLLHSVDDRRYLIEYLAAEVQANRMLECKLLEETGQELDLSTGRDREKNVLSSLRSICETCGYTSAKTGTGVLKRVQVELAERCKSVPPAMLEPVLKEDDVPLEISEFVRNVFNIMLVMYSKRKAAVLRRTQGTLLAFQWSDKPGLDLFNLKNKCDSLFQILSSKPAVGVSCLYCVTHLNLYISCCSCAGDKDVDIILKSQAKRFVMPQVPDRDGRVNSYNAEDRLEQDIERANRSMKTHTKDRTRAVGFAGQDKGKKGGKGKGKGKGGKGGGFHAANQEIQYGGAAYDGGQKGKKGDYTYNPGYAGKRGGK